MFRRSRRKIILAIMGSLMLLFVLTLSIIMLASYQEIRHRNMQILTRYVELHSLPSETDGAMPGPEDGTEAPEEPAPEQGERMEMPPGPGPEGWNRPGGPGPGKPPLDQRPYYQLATFYSIAFAEDGAVLAVDNGHTDVLSEEKLTEIAKGILDSGKRSGRKGNLTYMVSDKPGYTLVAMMDNTVSESGLSTLLRNVLIIGSGAIVLMFLLSLVLARQIIRPLEENDRMQKQFISDASHELKTPAAVISTNAEMLSREIGPNEWLSNILYETERMDGLVRQLLDLSRAENTDAPVEQVDFSRIVTGEALAFEALAFDQGRTIEDSVEEGISLTGNPTQLTQIVSILLENAIRHSTGREIRLSLRRQGNAAVLEVRNEGEAIPPEKLQHLFDRFYRVDEARTDYGHHYGLGLAIAKAIAEKHGGKIGVTCRDGTIQFTVSVPIKKV